MTSKTRTILLWVGTHIPFIALLTWYLNVVANIAGNDNAIRYQLKEEYELLKASGDAMDKKMVEQAYFARTSDEDADEWAEVFAEMESDSYLDSAMGIPLIDVIEPFNYQNYDFDVSAEWPSLDNCDEFTQRNADLIKSVQNLARKNELVRLEGDFQEFRVNLIEMGKMSACIPLLTLDAQVAVIKRDRERAFLDILALFGLSAHLQESPFENSMKAASMARGSACLAIKKAMWSRLLTREQTELLATECEKYSEIGAKWKRVVGEHRAINVSSVVKIRTKNGVERIEPFKDYQDSVLYLSIMRRAQELDTSDWERFIRERGRLQMEIEKLEPAKDRYDFSICRSAIPALSQLAEMFMEDAQQCRLAILALRLQIEGDRVGKLPVDLQSILQNSPKLKPYGQRGFGYMLENGTATLWGGDVNRPWNRTPLEIEEYKLGLTEMPPPTIVWQLRENP